MSTRVLVTGAPGFLGKAVLSALLMRGAEVWALSRRSGSAAHRTVEADLNDATRVNEVIATVRPDCVVHAAWQGVTGRHRNDSAQLKNLAALDTLLRACAEHGVRRVIGIGSQAEYGPCDTRISEEHTPRPDSRYGAMKLAAAHWGLRWASEGDRDYAWLRLFAAFGPGDSTEYVLPYVITSLLRGESPSLTAGEQRWDYLFVADAAVRVAEAATTERRFKGIFNLCSGKAIALRTIIEEAARQIGGAGVPKFGALPYRGDGRMFLEGDPTAFAATFGALPLTNLTDALRQTIEAMRRGDYVTT